MQTRCMDVITWHKRKVSHTVLLVPVLLLLAGEVYTQDPASVPWVGLLNGY